LRAAGAFVVPLFAHKLADTNDSAVLDYVTDTLHAAIKAVEGDTVMLNLKRLLRRLNRFKQHICFVADSVRIQTVHFLMEKIGEWPVCSGDLGESSMSIACRTSVGH
jgi:hypothetical protein